MNIIKRQIMTGLFLSIGLMAILAVCFYIVFPLNDWALLWEKELLDVPFVIFVPSLSVVLGISFGVLSGIHWRKQLAAVEEALNQLTKGQSLHLQESINYQYLDDVWKRIKSLQGHLSEQTKISQKHANEKAKEQEKRIQEVVSEERNRLARELHDSVSQQLFASSMMMSAINESMTFSNEHEKKQLKMVEHMIHQSQLEMRALLLHLRPVALKGKSLQEGIQEILLELKQKVPMDINWKVEPLLLPKGVEDHLFRILQESISNTLRHAQAARLEVLLIKRENMVIMRITDDGVGFEQEEVKTGSYGLQNMRERAIEIGGTLKIVSLKNKGTRLEVKVPLLGLEGEEDD